MGELAEQVLFFNHVKKVHPALWESRMIFAVPNGGKRTPMEAVKLKASGVLAGVSDIIVLLARGSYHGMCLEMKKDGGRLSPDQSLFLSSAKKHGYAAVVAVGHAEAIRVFNNYIALKEGEVL